VEKVLATVMREEDSKLRNYLDFFSIAVSFFAVKTKQNKTKQNKTKQNKTKQNKTKHVTWIIRDIYWPIVLYLNKE